MVKQRAKKAKRAPKAKATVTKRSRKRPSKVARAAAAHDAPAQKRVLQVITATSTLQAQMMSMRARGLTIGFVPTMGALHDGHAALLEEARRRADVVVCSIFVNPKQFGANEDLGKYPRDLESDRRLCDSCGVDIIYAPGVEEVYAPGFDTLVKAGALGASLEGAARPGHFDGVLTVVALLFHIVQPHFAVFGEKDYQQLALVRRMVRDLKMPVEIVPMPVIRAVDGLALSSRNAYLSEVERMRATALYRALVAGQDEAQRGTVDAARIATAARNVLVQTQGLEPAYVEVRDPRTLQPVTKLTADARLLLAAKVGAVRLIDNGPLFFGVRYQA
jgi:pantoate--beta-alanine ligase